MAKLVKVIFHPSIFFISLSFIKCFSPFLCQSSNLSIYLSIYLSTCVSICLHVHLSVYMYMYPSIHPFIQPSIHPSIHHLSIPHYFFQASVLVLLDMLNASINNISREDVKSNIPILIDIFITLFDYRIDDNQVSIQCGIYTVPDFINFTYYDVSYVLKSSKFG